MSEETALTPYESPEGPAGSLSRLLPSLMGYMRIFRVVWWSRNLAVNGQYDTERWIKGSRGIIDALESVGVRFRVEGLSEAPAAGKPYVFLGNHMSTLETFVLPWILRDFMPVTYVIKEALTRFPVFKHVVLARNPIVVTRTNPREDLTRVLKQGTAFLEAGTSVIIFPQTTRTPYFSPATFNSIGVKLARRAGVPVVPLAVKTDAWLSDGWPIKDFGRIDPSRPVRMRFGAPMAVEGNGRETNLAAATFIREHLGSWGVEIREA